MISGLPGSYVESRFLWHRLQNRRQSFRRLRRASRRRCAPPDGDEVWGAPFSYCCARQDDGLHGEHSIGSGSGYICATMLGASFSRSTRFSSFIRNSLLQLSEGFTGGLSAGKYIAITKAKRATATRDLQKLVDLHILRKTGERRHARYWLIK